MCVCFTSESTHKDVQSGSKWNTLDQKGLSDFNRNPYWHRHPMLAAPGSCLICWPCIEYVLECVGHVWRGSAHCHSIQWIQAIFALLSMFQLLAVVQWKGCIQNIRQIVSLYGTRLAYFNASLKCLFPANEECIRWILNISLDSLGTGYFLTWFRINTTSGLLAGFKTPTSVTVSCGATW